MAKQYLGDAVYADTENGMLKLTTEDGIRATNTIYLEDFVWLAAIHYVANNLWKDARLVASESELDKAIKHTDALLAKETDDGTD